MLEAHVLLANVEKHPDVTRADVAGSIRRHNEVVADIDIVAECASDPEQVAESFGRAPGVIDAKAGEDPGSVRIRFVDGSHLDMYCVSGADYPVALWRASGSPAHVEEMAVLAQAKGFRITGNLLSTKFGNRVAVAREEGVS